MEPPMMPVMTPTGNSKGEITVRAMVSQRIRNVAPAKKDPIKTIR